MHSVFLTGRLAIFRESDGDLIVIDARFEIIATIEASLALKAFMIFTLNHFIASEFWDSLWETPLKNQIWDHNTEEEEASEVVWNAGTN